MEDYMADRGDAAGTSRVDMVLRHLTRKFLRVLGKISVRERENDFVLSCLKALRKTANQNSMRVLDLGSSSSLLPLRLARRGFEIVAVDIRPYPFSHKNLTTVQADIIDPHFGDNFLPFDVVTCVSTLEHIGIGYYEDNMINNGDKISLENIYKTLKPEGSFLITMPYSGHFSQDNFQRIYDEQSINKLFSEGWVLKMAKYYIPRGKKDWILSTKNDAAKNFSAYAGSNNACFWFIKAANF